MGEKDKIKDLQEEVRLYKRIADSTSRGMSRMKKEEFQDMKLQVKNMQNAIGKLQKENNQLRRKIVGVDIKKDGDSYVISEDKYDIVTQGRTIEEAKRMFAEAFILYLETKIKLGQLFEYKY